MEVLRRARPSGAFEGAGFPALGRLIVRHPLMVIAAWVAIAAVLFLTIPPLMQVAEKNPPGFLPADSTVMAATTHMQEAFDEGDTENFVVVILSSEKGLSPQDEGIYRRLVDRLKADTANVLSTQDFISIPELRDVMTSEDKKAWQLPVSLQGTMGKGDGQEAYRNFVEVVKDTTANTALTANVIGPAATFDDLNKIGARDQHVIEAATVLIVLTILILVYRNLVAMILPMVTIGVALVVAQQVVAGLGDRGVLGLGPQTFMLMTAMMIGAGVDYAVFLFSRYHECVRCGLSSDDAVVAALGSIGKVIAGSAGTVAITFLGLAFTNLGVFSTVGPALSVSVGVGFVASVTLLPALIALAGRRGWVSPRKDLTGRWWRLSGVHIVRRPVVHLATSLVILLALASCTALVKFNYDDRENLPADSESNMGYAALDKHFPVSSTVQQFILIQSPQDLRSPKALADMEQMAQRVSQLPDIAMVRGITRPTGEVLEQAKATVQAGEVGSKLRDASTLIADNETNLNMLGGGAHTLADTLGQLRNGVVQAIVTVRPLANALADMQQKFGGSKTFDEIDKTATLVANMRSLGDAMGINLSRITDVYVWATPMINALNVSPICNLDPACVSSRAGLQRLVTAANDGTLEKIAELARQLQATEGAQTLDQAVSGLGTSMNKAIDAARQLGLDDPNSVQQQLASAEEGANLLADSSQQLADGVQLLVDQTKTVGGGLDQASAFLLAMKRDAANPPMSGFYIPPQILTQEEFKKAATLFVSLDGHTARYLVQTALNPFGTESMDQVKEIIKTAESARPNTTLADAKISMVGFSAVQNEIRTYYNADIQFIIIVTLIVVFLILVVLLRSLVAPIYLVGSVILSYMSALGIGVVFFQFVLGQEIAWSVPGMTFLVLVAVGADYNLLLISRIRDEASRGVRTGVIRTIGATGGVITSAGLIFAASMFGLTFSSVVGVVQIGFVIGVGLLLDTFLVRTITVPAIAVLVGKANWWPAKLTFLTHKTGRHRAKVAREPAADVRGEEISDVAGGAIAGVNGEVTAGVNGEVTAGANGEVTAGANGEVTADANGEVTAGANGEVNGEVTADVNGEVTADVNGEVTADVNGEVTADLGGKAKVGVA
jgi:RND superfamily putative drug exporter